MGTIGTKSFLVFPGNQYGKSFRPIIEGSIAESKTETIVNIRMNLFSYIVEFMIAWLTMCLLFCIVTIISAILTERISFGNFVPLLMLCGGYALMHIGFRFGVKKTRKKLDPIISFRNSLVK